MEAKQLSTLPKTLQTLARDFLELYYTLLPEVSNKTYPVITVGEIDGESLEINESESASDESLYEEDDIAEPYCKFDWYYNNRSIICLIKECVITVIAMEVYSRCVNVQTAFSIDIL